jgi:Hemerythrin HHE cation binding domain
MNGSVMDATTLSPNTLDTIADEHESLANLYERILDALRAGPGELLPASNLLDELVERLAVHFVHEEEGGYYSHVVEVAPWRTPAVDELKRQHGDLLRMVTRIARGARMANESSPWLEAVRREFAQFRRRIIEHEGKENRLVQEVYIFDIAAAA